MEGSDSGSGEWTIQCRQGGGGGGSWSKGRIQDLVLSPLFFNIEMIEKIPVFHILIFFHREWVSDHDQNNQAYLGDWFLWVCAIGCSLIVGSWDWTHFMCHSLYFVELLLLQLEERHSGGGGGTGGGGGCVTVNPPLHCNFAVMFVSSAARLEVSRSPDTLVEPHSSRHPPPSNLTHKPPPHSNCCLCAAAFFFFSSTSSNF